MSEIDELRSELETDGRIRPSYGRWGVSNVPDTVADLLGVSADRPLSNAAIASLYAEEDAPIEHVVVVVIDGVGWLQFHELASSTEQLRRLRDSATISPLTSTYPSETAAAMPTIYTGLQPVEHGLIGWFTRFDDPTMIVHSLPFLTLDGQPVDDAYGHDPTDLLDMTHRSPITEVLTDAGVEVGYLNPMHIADSATSQLTSGAASLIGYPGIESAFSTVADRINGADSPTYHLVYWGESDAQGHHHGTGSASYRSATIDVLDGFFDRFVPNLEDSVASNTAVLMVADHGQVNTDPATNIDLAATGDLELGEHLERGHDGSPLYLAGGPRNLQLHLDSTDPEDLRRNLEVITSMCTYDSTELRDIDLFGDRSESKLFGNRLPDLLAIPDAGSMWYDDGELDHIGMHGGMVPEEMLVPLVALRASRLT